jgi:serine 3-dehydrogenase
MTRRDDARQTLKNKIVAITGASSGIGAACAEEFARRGCALLLFARRLKRIQALAKRLVAQHESRVLSFPLDVRSADDVRKVFSSLPGGWGKIDILVNNAGLARGLSGLHEGNIPDWDEMIDTNIKGLLYVTRAVLPGMVQRNRGHVINIGSIAGHQTYPSGNVYCASKFAVTGLSRGLRMDLLGTSVRVSTVDPGLVKTEFSMVRFRGDKVRAGKTYAGVRVLHPRDVAEAVLFCATRPLHVNVAELVVMPIDQASVGMVHRRQTPEASSVSK